jgi:type III restriction enzyme
LNPTRIASYLTNILKDAKKLVYEHVIYDSSRVENQFTEQLEKNETVKVYAKLPSWFKIPTPPRNIQP